MSAMDAQEVRRHLAGLTLANEYEIEELRRTPVEVKLRQLWALMSSAHLFDDPMQREVDVQRIRERWSRLRQALDAGTRS
jgi:hypothetical protein